MVPNLPATTSTLSEATSAADDLNDYDVISDHDPRSLESSLADLESTLAGAARSLREPAPSSEALTLYETAAMGAAEVQAFVQRTLRAGDDVVSRTSSAGRGDSERVYRVYVDGLFDTIHAGTALQLRQAKLALPSVHLLVGPFTDVHCRLHGIHTVLPHVERCELVRHVRWVDQVIHDAPVVIDEAILSRYRIDYVAVEEGTSLDPAVIKARLAGYDLVKSLGKALTTRRTKNLVAPSLALTRESMPTPATPSRKNFDPPTPSETKERTEDADNTTKRLGNLSLSIAAYGKEMPDSQDPLDERRVQYSISSALSDALDRSHDAISALPQEKGSPGYACAMMPEKESLEVSPASSTIPEPLEEF